MTKNYSDFFKNKKVTIMGLGLLGRGIGDAAFIAAHAEQVLVTDLKDESALKDSIEKLKTHPNIIFRLGKHDIADFTNCDMVIKAAGVPLESPYIQAAQEAGVPVYMSTALFAYLADIPVIGVTGTRGKSTVTQIIYEGLKAAGQSVILGGNVRGVSTLSLLPEVKTGDVAVLELDSWQLQGFRSLKISPHIAIFTNLMPDHMNYYKDSMEQYFYDKAGIFANQKEQDYLITDQSMHDQISQEYPKSRVIIPALLDQDWNLTIPGDHNRRNAALAFAALRLIVPAEKQSILRQVIENYQGMDGRLSLVAEVNGIRFYNDSNATTPQATIAALQSFESGNICLLAGGADKGLALDDLAGVIKYKCKSVVFLQGSGTERLSQLLPNIPVFNSIDDAFQVMVRLAAAGDVCLLSPAFASFGMFRNEYERSDAYNRLVENYKKNKAV